MATCRGTDEHCCHLGRHGVCQLLRDDGPDAKRRWVCTVRERAGSWEAAHRDPEYVERIAPIVRELAGVDCGDWPPLGQSCAACGVTG